MDLEQAILSLPGKTQNGYRVIRCPFHNDTNPSFSVKIKPPFQGRFKCWSCPAKGPFSELAEKLGLSYDATATPSLYPENYKNVFSDDPESIKEISYDLYSLSDSNLKKITNEDTWRGYDSKFLRSVGARAMVDAYGNKWVYLPVTINDELKGYIKARPTKVPKKPSYLNKPGAWSKKWGLFPFDKSVSLHGKSMVIVEGPRDALRLIREEIPAVAILGTNSWTEFKANLLDRAGIENLILCLDGDEAGRIASKEIKKSVGSLFNIVDFELYNIEGEFDPGNMPKVLVRHLRKMI